MMGMGENTKEARPVHTRTCGKGAATVPQRQNWELFGICMKWKWHPILISSVPSKCKPAEFNKPAVIKCQMAAFSRVGK